MDTPNKIKNRLNRYKKANRYSIRLLAIEIGVKTSWLVDFAKGKYQNPTYSNMEKVHKYLMRMDK